MYRHLIRTIMVFLFAVFFLISQVASGQAQYAPPTTVTLTMYQLNQDQGGASTGIPCKEGDRTYGCTTDPDNEDFAYPFSGSIITLSIDGNPIIDPDSDGDLVEDNAYDPAQRYLWDVAAQEIGLQGSNGVKPLAGVEAQAIASRTYTYQRILENYTINNSASLHVFLPYKFETLGQTEKNRLVEAMRHRYYMTPGTDNPNTAANEAIYPILAMYGADNRGMTTQGAPEGQTANPSTNYLSAIADPINDRYGCALISKDAQGEDVISYLTNDDSRCGTGNGGMSSKGAAVEASQ